VFLSAFTGLIRVVQGKAAVQVWDLLLLRMQYYFIKETFLSGTELAEEPNFFFPFQKTGNDSVLTKLLSETENT
jgi:hypothetical protein